MRSPLTSPSKTHQITLTPALEVKDLSVAYNNFIALKPSSFSIPPASLMAIAGPNGAGKSSLLKAILGIVKRQSGQVFVNGHAFNHAHQAATYHIAYVPQRAHIDWFFPITVQDVVAMGLKTPRLFHYQDKKNLLKRVHIILKQVGMDNLAHRQIGSLSGGQQQRVFFARALVSQPKILLLDEPFNGIDAPTTALLFQLLNHHKTHNHTAIIAVHHDVHTLPQFDTVTLVNQSLIVSDNPLKALTPENLQRTYGAPLTLS